MQDIKKKILIYEAWSKDERIEESIRKEHRQMVIWLRQLLTVKELIAACDKIISKCDEREQEKRVMIGAYKAIVDAAN